MAEISADIKKGVQNMDPKMKETVLWSAAYHAGVVAVQGIANVYIFSFGLLGGLAGMAVGAIGMISALVGGAIFGAIVGAIIGFILAMWFPQIMELQKKYLKDYVNSLYKLLFYVYILAAAWMFVNNLQWVLPALLSAAVTLATGWAYAKLMKKKLGKYYV